MPRSKSERRRASKPREVASSANGHPRGPDREPPVGDAGEVAALRSQVDLLTEQLAKAEAAAATAECTSLFLTAGVRELAGKAASERDASPATVSQQLVYLWQYT